MYDSVTIQQFLFYGILIFIVVRYFYICIKYPFWTHMPVYHTYDYHHFFTKSSREMQLFPYKNKFSNPIQIKTINYYELNDTYVKYFVELLQCFYIPSDIIFYTIVEKEMKARFSGHFDTPFVSFYNDKNYISSGKKNDPNKQFDILSTNVEITLFPEPKGCIASYPVRTFYHPKTEYKCANYLTYISTDRSYKEQNISRNLISTHDYNIRRHNPEIRVSILKKEVGNCDGVVPLITFTTCLLNLKISRFAKRVKNIVEVYRQNWDIMFDTLFELYKPNDLFDFVMSIDIGAIKSRIEAEILFVYAFCEKGVVLAMYFIENAHILYEKTTEKTLRLVASINNGLTSELFYQGFMECLRKIIKQNLDFKMILIENVGHNIQIMEKTKEDRRFNKLEETTGAYYFINWLFLHKVVRERSFLLC